MAYGNASKKTVPLSALSKEDLDYIAGHINTFQGEKINILEQRVIEAEDKVDGMKNYVDDAIQSAIYDSWGSAV